MGRKFVVGSGAPYVTYTCHVASWAEAYSSLPTGILIHPAVWPQQAWAENWGTVPLFGVEAGPI